MELPKLLSNLRVEPMAAHGPLRLVRLIGDKAGPEADLLEDSLPAGRTSITEVSASGVVALVRVTHTGSLPLLLLDGEQIVGAKQNRIINSSFLVAPGQTVEVPVSCVEQRRWAYKSQAFGTSDTTVTAIARSAKLKRVTSSLGLGRGYDSDQRAVWRDVDGYLDRTSTHSISSAFEDAYRERRAAADRAMASFEPARDQVGIAAVCDGVLLSLDIFGSPSLYARAWKKVARGLFAEAYREAAPPGEADAARIVEASLDAIAKAAPGRTPAPGIGETLHLTSDVVTFSGLTNEGMVYHAVAAGGAAATGAA